MKRSNMRSLVQTSDSTEPRDWYRIDQPRAEADSGQSGSSSATVFIYGVIGDSWWEDSVPASQFVRDMAALDVDEIQLRIHSPGGDLYDGVAIANAIRSHKAHTVLTVDGLAASMASVIAIAANEVVMAPGSQMMVHDPWSIEIGNAAAMHETAAWLDKQGDNMAELYATKAGGTAASWREVMRVETWYNADEAVAAGLADRVSATKAEKAKASAQFDLSIFAHAGREHSPAPLIPGRARAQIPPAEPVEHPQPSTEGTATMPDILTSGLRERLGIKADAELDDAGYLAAVDEALAERAESTTHAPGTVLIDEGALAELQASAALGRAAHERQVTTDREAAIANAVSTGRIPAARADAWRTQLTADPGAVEVLNALPENTVPMQALGYTGGVEASTDNDVDVRETPGYKNWSN